MPHANERLLRDAYAAFSRGDTDAFFALCTPDFRLHVPGDGLLSGVHSRESFLAALETAMTAVEGVFDETVLAIVANDEWGCVYVHQSAPRDGTTWHWNAVHLYRFDDGRLAEFRELTDDHESFARAWHR